MSKKDKFLVLKYYINEIKKNKITGFSNFGLIIDILDLFWIKVIILGFRI